MKLIQERNKSVTYKEARVYLDELSKYGSVLGLDAIRGLLRELGNPQDDLRFILSQERMERDLCLPTLPQY